MRYLPNVINEMLLEIPESYNNLREELISVRQSGLYTAPEIMHLQWIKAAEALNIHLPFPPKESWQARVGAIFAGKLGEKP